MVVWIEITTPTEDADEEPVTTCVVVWIEIPIYGAIPYIYRSPPAWWCGLKYL